MSRYDSWSAYEIAVELLKLTRCPDCHGSGKLDDAAPGDISFKVWACPKCEGFGLDKDAAVPPELDAAMQAVPYIQ